MVLSRTDERVRSAGHCSQESVEIRCRYAIHLDDLRPGYKAITGRGGTVCEITHIHAHGRDTALRTHRPVWRLQCRAAPLNQPVDIPPRASSTVCTSSVCSLLPLQIVTFTSLLSAAARSTSLKRVTTLPSIARTRSPC